MTVQQASEPAHEYLRDEEQDQHLNVTIDG